MDMPPLRWLVIGLITPRRSAFEAFYACDGPVILAIGFFPILAWLIARRARRRGFGAGVIMGLVAVPVLAAIAMAFSFRHGV